jgi:gluconate 5-dehydrogenase
MAVSTASLGREVSIEAAVLLPLFGLHGRVALVTGAARGLGLQASRILASAGAHVVLNGRDIVALDAATQDILARGGSAESAMFDVTDGAAAETAVRSLVASRGRLDILINNVGPRDRRSVTELPADAFASLLDAHVVSAYRLARCSAQSMKQRAEGGRIINMSSVAAFCGARDDVAYGAAKAAMDGMTRSLAADLGAYQITVNSIAPGPFVTERNLATFESPQTKIIIGARTMLRRAAEPHEIQGAVLLLASPAGSYITGHTLVVDAGMSKLL